MHLLAIGVDLGVGPSRALLAVVRFELALRNPVLLRRLRRQLWLLGLLLGLLRQLWLLGLLRRLLGLLLGLLRQQWLLGLRRRLLGLLLGLNLHKIGKGGE